MPLRLVDPQPKTASNQVMGSVVWGIGTALHEETLSITASPHHDANIADIMPVNADVQDIR